MKAEIKAQSGFTMIELMIVTAIVAILASIAIPSYNDYVTRSKIAEAVSKLSEGRVRMEQWFQDARTYQGGLGCATIGSPVAANANPITFNDAKYFTYNCSTLGANTYVLTATGVATQGMDGFSYTLDDTNSKTTSMTGYALTNGWTDPAPNNCWANKKGGAC